MKDSESILYIDDNANRRNNLSSRLRMQGFTVEMTGSGFHSLHLLEKESYNLIILTKTINDMPCIEVIGLIRELYDHKKLPIIYLSYDDDITELKEIIKKGANECILKPDNFHSLLEKIQKFI